VLMLLQVGLDSLVGIVTRYGMDGPGIESWWRRDSPHTSIPHWDPTDFLYNGYQISLPGAKATGRGVDHPPPLLPRLKKEI
jgi:hypothetical protein